MLRLNLKKQQPLIVLRQCHIFARFLLVFLLLTMAVGKPNYLTNGAVPRDSHVGNEQGSSSSPSMPHVTFTTPTPSSIQPWFLQVLRGATSASTAAQLQTNVRSASSPQLREHSPEFHLLPDPGVNTAISSPDEGEKTWRLQLATNSEHVQGQNEGPQFSTKVQQADIVTRTHISEYNYSNVEQMSAVPVGHAMSMALPAPAGRNQRSAAVDPGVAAAADLDESTVRNERSTNLSHLTGTARKIQMFVKNRHLQILPDGTVNGTFNDTSDFTVLQRSSMDSFGGVQIQGVATCLFLCMNTCGLLYGAAQTSEECLFRENLEQDNYNTYSSVRHSNSRKTLYLALDGRGSSRKVQITAARQKRQQQLAAGGGGGSYSNAALGKLSTYARVLTRTVSTDRVEDLVKRLLINRQRQQLANISDSFESDRSVDSGLAFRHHGYHHLCPVSPSFVTPSPPPVRTPASRCPKKGKTPIRKKRKKKCSDEEDPDKCKREKRKNMQKKKKGANNNNNMKTPGPKRKKQQGILASRQTNRTTTVSVTAVPTIESSSIASD